MKVSIPLFALVLLMAPTSAMAEPLEHPGSVTDLIPREPARKEQMLSASPGTTLNHIVVKFQEGTQTRLRNGLLVALERSQRENERLDALGLEPVYVEHDLATVQELVRAAPGVTRLRRLFTPGEQVLAEIRRLGEARSGRELADLDLYYRIDFQPGADVGALVDALNALPSVELAYLPARGKPAASDIPPTTPSFTGQQGYLEAASAGGIDARYAWTLSGGKGQGVKIVDAEWDWNVFHEDLPSLFYWYGDSRGDLNRRNHGTAVLGVIAAGDNGYGVTGIANQAQIGTAHIKSYATVGQEYEEVADAIARAGLTAGLQGIVLVEWNLGYNIGLPCGCWGCFMPVEVEQAPWDAINNVVSCGVVVVEAAGNGGMNLDEIPESVPSSRVNRADSGAILVGASEAGTNRSKTCFSNYGSRVDVHSWGDSVTTLGYGYLFGSFGENQYYTNAFNGTSSASAIITGAVGIVQGVSLAHGLGALDSRMMRNLLRNTGVASPHEIGTQPDLKRGLDDYLSPPTASFTYSCSGRTCSLNGLSSTDNFGIQWHNWQFGDGTKGIGAVAVHTYPRTGIFYATLKVTDYTGRVHQITKAITVN
jgi:serine protease